MTDATALAPSLIVLGLYIGLSPVLERRFFAVRVALAVAIVLLIARYIDWRFAQTVWPALDGSLGACWIVFCFVSEVLVLADTALVLVMLSRTTNRSPEADRHELIQRALPPSRLPSVDVLIPTYNEDLDVLERTIGGALSIDYPRFTVWVLDDGKRDWLREYCQQVGARYLRRSQNHHAKAGNINDALPHLHGDLVAIFDADFVPHRDFIYRTIGFFADPKVGCVQTPQHFFNKDPVQLNLGLDNLWPEEQRFFFNEILPSRDGWDAAFCCGSGAIFRRSTLLDIGGIPTDSVTEDMLSSLVMLRRGQVTRYLNERLSLGLAAESINAFFVQRKRWCRGGLQLLYLRTGPLGPGLNLMHRLLFLPTYWGIQIPVRLLGIAIPIVYMLTGYPPIHVVPLDELLSFQLPVFLAFPLAMRWIAPSSYFPFVTTAASLFMAIRLTPTVLATLVKPFGVPFKVTPKGQQQGGLVYDKSSLGFVAVATLLNLIGLLINIDVDTRILNEAAFFPVAAGWAIINVVLLGLVGLMCFERPRRRKQERFQVNQASHCTIDQLPCGCVIQDLSIGGARLIFPGEHPATQGAGIALSVPGVGQIDGHVVWSAGDKVGVRFHHPAAEIRVAIDQLALATGRQVPAQRRQTPRVRLDQESQCVVANALLSCQIIDASLGGTLLRMPADLPLALGDRIRIEMPSVGEIDARVVRRQGELVGTSFKGLTGKTRLAMIRRLYTTHELAVDDNKLNSERLVVGLLRRAFGRAPS